MGFFVAIHQEAWPDRLDQLLTTIRRSLDTARSSHPGRRNTRLFQRLGQPTQLLALSEWDSEAAFAQFLQWPVFVDTVAACGPPPIIEPLVSLRRYERVAQRLGIVACATVTAPIDQVTSVEALLLSEAHRRFTTADGLVSREVYRARQPNPNTGAAAGRLLLVHGWRSLADLEQFRASESLGGEEELARLGATTTRFTGALAAEFSLDWPSTTTD